MSLSADGRKITCDGQNCLATAWLPVGLTALLPRGAASDTESVRGWLFVTKRGHAGHYCPACIPRHLGAIVLPSDIPTETAV
jgi:hypothetical protein